MSKFTVNFGMTFAKKWTYREPEICRNRNKSTFRQNIGPSDPCIWKNKKIHTQYHFICIFNSKSLAREVVQRLVLCQVHYTLMDGISILPCYFRVILVQNLKLASNKKSGYFYAFLYYIQF